MKYILRLLTVCISVVALAGCQQWGGGQKKEEKKGSQKKQSSYRLEQVQRKN